MKSLNPGVSVGIVTPSNVIGVKIAAMRPRQVKVETAMRSCGYPDQRCGI